MGGLPIEGVAVQVAKCFEASDSNSSLQRFILTDTNEHDYSKIKPEISSDDELCLDRGDDSSEDGSGIQLQQCQEDSESQLWKIQNHKISSDFGELQKCLDIEEDSGPYQVPDEPYPSEKFLQTWTCFEGNENQMWKLVQI
ncbi:uncharacterized protein L201_003976 [Kwoniella dendrophila CBS 6074]|uniref:Ricin B lectin domain-containing protein n=1 Tax=Kwoniella dendrophila CBS 6074 TaxID=1295534 RepID=A0AAX4JVY7_9TREE